MLAVQDLLAREEEVRALFLVDRDSVVWLFGDSQQLGEISTAHISLFTVLRLLVLLTIFLVPAPEVPLPILLRGDELRE